LAPRVAFDFHPQRGPLNTSATPQALFNTALEWRA